MLHKWHFFQYSAFVLATLSVVVVDSDSASPRGAAVNLFQPSDATALLGFKSKADFNDRIRFSHRTSFHFCQWQGVQCQQYKVTRLVIEDLDLGGVFASNTLSRLDQLRVLSLQNNSLTGPIPNLSGLVNLKSLFLDHNSFTGTFPPSILSLHRLRTLDFSYNNLSGPLPALLSSLDRIHYLRLEWNRFNGTVPPLSQSSLEIFNVSGNNLSGAVPVTPALLRFGVSSFSLNPGLCGEIMHKECDPSPPFFDPSVSAAAPPPKSEVLGQTAELHGVELRRRSPDKHRRTAVIIGFSTGIFVVIGSLCFVLAIKKQRNQNQEKESSTAIVANDAAATAEAAVAIQAEQENELEEKVKRVQRLHLEKSGSLKFCAGEAQQYTLDQLMRASAELLGRGSIGTTYKAVLDNRLIVSVKRIDANKLAGTSKETFERHMESVGELRHPNLVPLRAYFQVREERLLVYDYQPNGSLFSLIHGCSKSTRAKPLHWTSCLKIAEDIAQGLSYIHQAWRLVHGNLKSSNVLLGPDFEACVVDYCLAALAVSDNDHVPEAASSYKAPETRNSNHEATAKSDVYSYGVVLLELLSGKNPSQFPHLVPEAMVNWVRSAREDDGRDDDRLVMLIEVAMACSLTSPEQRPTMWQVLKMLQEIKEAVAMEDTELDPHSGLS